MKGELESVELSYSSLLIPRCSYWLNVALGGFIDIKAALQGFDTDRLPLTPKPKSAQNKDCYRCNTGGGPLRPPPPTRRQRLPLPPMPLPSLSIAGSSAVAGKIRLRSAAGFVGSVTPILAGKYK